jgi:hypothetical protein
MPFKKVQEDQDPDFIIDRGIKLGIARRFVENIGKWVRKLRKVVPGYDIRLDRILIDGQWAFWLSYLV